MDMWWSDRAARLVRSFVLTAAALAAAAAAAPAQTIGFAEARSAGYGTVGDRTFGQAVRGNFAMHVGLPAPERRMIRLAAAFETAAPGPLLFAFDSASLDAEAGAALAAQARWLNLNPQARLRLEGHADLVGGEPYNARLGLRRARAVARRLVELGVNPDRLVAVESLGETQPVVAVEAPEPRNRRVVVTLAGWGRPLPSEGFDGRRAFNTYRRYIADEVEQARAEGAGGS